ncbi:MAG TPA: lysoplasmalogenase [Vicinamibacteria bacterium]|nr:lysoplasmalogenase [Vicinamibacteria bacterium]
MTRLAVALKPLPVLCLAAWVAASARTPAAWLVVAGLVLSLIADVLIETSFLGGLGVFLFAHVAYVAAFLARTSEPRPLLALPFLLWGAFVLARLWPGLGPMRVPVVVYAAVICAMMWRAAATTGTPGGWIALAGAVLFAASDTVLAFDRFHRPITGARAPILGLYWAGQLLIALSARR